MDMVLESSDAPCILDLLEGHFSRTRCIRSDTAVLSLFPHHHKPEITGILFDLLAREQILPEAVAHSTSAISAVVPEKRLKAVTHELFRTFRFSAFRTPEDWTLAQREKERLYREVVASYQEQQPRVYGLDWHDNQELLQVRLNVENLGPLAALFYRLSSLQIPLIFLTSTPSTDRESRNLFFCLPESQKTNYEPFLAGLPSRAVSGRRPAVAHFSMNGPHFGDRYGIAGEMFKALQEAGVELLALSCSIASIAGAVPAHQMNHAIESMRRRFDIPSVNQRS
jgi:aspartokinase